MAITAESFRWLDILEKEFDKSYVDLDLLIGELDSDEPEMVYNARQKMATLSSCFAQLTHKAQTIFQNNAKNEAELVNMRAELVDVKTRSQCLEEELHKVLVELHTTQLQQLQTNNAAAGSISHKLHSGLLQRSPTHKAQLSGVNLDALVMSLENWKCRLELENESLRHSLVSLQAEVCGARLAARYLDKELAGRIQQLQLLGRQDMSGDTKDRLWSQLEAEILLQRHKTVMRAVRQPRTHRSPPSDKIGRVRTVLLQRRPDQGLGISITGGREHGVPILISELEPGGDSGDLYVGDSVLSVNGIDLSQASHQEAVKLLSNQTGNVTLTVQYLTNCGDDSEEDSDLNNLSYRFFEEMPEGMVYRMNGFSENNKQGGEMLITPTAPRTPDSSARGGSEYSYSSSPSGTRSVKEERLEPTPTPALDTPVASPRHFGVTTLQKIFRSLTPSGAWQEISEDKVISVGEPDSEQGQEAGEELRVQPIEPEEEKQVAEPLSNKLPEMPPKQVTELLIKQASDTLHVKQIRETVPMKATQQISAVTDSPTIHVRRKVRTTSQVFHPDTEAVTLIDGLGDASFGTPV